ncbi:MAG: hypothetical protein CXZ00_16255 [Acidobacteria bacterium]|mgnify:CR=1 FL=1|nr:MAG: hypothetical protein CXZ00_16255 [Acidobacteriota bacterium]
MDDFLTAQDMDKFGKAPRRAYIEKQGIICADAQSEGRNKRYTYPMGFKWGFVSYFDAIYNINTASTLTNAIMEILPQIVSRGENQEDGMRVWFIILDNEICFSGLSYNHEYQPQPEEQENLMKFTVFSAQYFPGVEVDIWAKPIPQTTPWTGFSGGGAGMGYTVLKKEPPKFISRKTSLAKSIAVHCISDIFEEISAKLAVNPYRIPVEEYRKMTSQVREVNIEDIVFKIN